MTAPNQPNPDGSATQGGLSSFAAKTAAQRKAETTAPVKNSLETNFFGSWISNMFGGFINGILGFISFLVYALKGVSGGLIDLTGLLADTQNTANNAQETAAAASNLAVLYNFDVAANRDKYPPSGAFSFANVGYAVSGSYVALLAPVAGYTGYQSMRVGLAFRVTPGEKIYMDWRQRRNSANFAAKFNIRFLDASGALLQEVSPIMAGSPPEEVLPSVSATNNTWAQYKGTVEVPVGAYDAIPELKLLAAGGQSLSGTWAFDNVIARRASEADLTAIEAQLAGKANYSDIPTDVPLWQNINPSDDSVFPMSGLVFWTTGDNDGGSYRETRNPVFSTSSGDMDLGYIRSTRDREYTQIGFMTAKGAIIGAGPLEAWLHLYKMDLTTGLLTLLWNSGNIKSAIQSAGSGKMLRFAMPQVHADQGDVFAVGLVQRANALNPSYAIYGATMPYTEQPAGVHPRGLSSRATVGTTFPSASTIASASQVWTNENTPWFVLG